MLKIFIKSITIIFVLTFMSTAHAGDASKGKKVFNKCKACHGIDEGGKNKLGPNLWNTVGGPIAAAEGYKYSKALIAYGEEAGTWNEENLDAWLKKPKGLVRKTKMIFSGLKKEADRANLIAYLKENGNN